MKFYSIRNSNNKKILGTYPQVKEIKYDCHVWDEPKFIEHVNFTKVEFNPIVANAVLYSKSKPTDLINVSGMGFTRKLLVSGRLKSILETYKEQGLQFFESHLLQKENEIKDFWVLNATETGMGNIDFKESDVFITKNTFEKLDKIEIKDENKFMTIRDSLKYPDGIIIDKYSIKNDVSDNFFALSNVEGGVQYIVSEKLKQEIEGASCTGIEFMPIELRLTEWLQGGERENVYGKT